MIKATIKDSLIAKLDNFPYDLQLRLPGDYEKNT